MVGGENTDTNNDNNMKIDVLQLTVTMSNTPGQAHPDCNSIYFFPDGSDGKKQYTMCHEIGHGFGLPHTDENCDNADTGECMDYTDEPENNASPSPRNFEFLRVMYGTLNDGNGGDSRRSLSWLGHGQDPIQASKQSSKYSHEPVP